MQSGGTPGSKAPQSARAGCGAGLPAIADSPQSRRFSAGVGSARFQF